MIPAQIKKLGPAIAVFLATFAILGMNAAPGVTFHDSGEFALAAKSFGIPHSPGAPTWTILAGLFARLTGFQDTARATALFSAFCGAITLALVYATVKTWSSAKGWMSEITALVPVLALLGCGAFLEQAETTEQYTLLTALLMTILLVATKTLKMPEAKRWKGLLALGVLYGLAVGNHPSQVILGPLMLVVAWQATKEKKAFGKAMATGTAGILGGLLVFLWLPIRSAAGPVMDWGHPDTMARILWSVSRKQWPTRPMSTAPAGFVKEWFASYNLWSQLGPIVLVLAIAGLVLFAQKGKRELGWLALAVLPYSLILLLGHLRQQGMDNVYIRHYGVIDWHLPLYIGVAICGGFGALAVLQALSKTKFAPVAAAGIALGLGFFAFTEVQSTSLRNFEAPERYARNVLAPLPENAMIVATSDDMCHVLAYTLYSQAPTPKVWMGYGLPMVDMTTSPEDRTNLEWNARRRLTYLTHDVFDPDKQPLNPLRLTSQEVRGRPLFAEFNTDYPNAAQWMLPSGFLYELRDVPVGNEEVLAAQRKLEAEHPELYRGPTGHPERLEREAFSQAHQRRGAYFLARGLPEEAAKAYRLALEWEPDNAQIWFGLGCALDEQKSAEPARKAYVRAIEIMDTLPGPHQNLAILYAKSGDLKTARELLKDEIKINPNALEAKGNLRLVERQLEARY